MFALFVHGIMAVPETFKLKRCMRTDTNGCGFFRSLSNTEDDGSAFRVKKRAIHETPTFGHKVGDA